MPQDWKDTLGSVVYSTNPDFTPKDTEETTETTAIPPQQQCLYVSHDKKHRAGKVVTLVEGFKGSSHQLDELAKMLKQKCGVGGTSKDGYIVIQGEYRDRVIDLLQAQGFKTKKKGG